MPEPTTFPPPSSPSRPSGEACGATHLSAAPAVTHTTRHPQRFATLLRRAAAQHPREEHQQSRIRRASPPQPAQAGVGPVVEKQQRWCWRCPYVLPFALTRTPSQTGRQPQLSLPRKAASPTRFPATTNSSGGRFSSLPAGVKESRTLSTDAITQFLCNLQQQLAQLQACVAGLQSNAAAADALLVNPSTLPLSVVAAPTIPGASTAAAAAASSALPRVMQVEYAAPAANAPSAVCGGATAVSPVAADEKTISDVVAVPDCEQTLGWVSSASADPSQLPPQQHRPRHAPSHAEEDSTLDGAPSTIASSAGNVAGATTSTSAFAPLLDAATAAAPHDVAGESAARLREYLHSVTNATQVPDDAVDVTVASTIAAGSTPTPTPSPTAHGPTDYVPALCTSALTHSSPDTNANAAHAHAALSATAAPDKQHVQLRRDRSWRDAVAAAGRHVFVEGNDGRPVTAAKQRVVLVASPAVSPLQTHPSAPAENADAMEVTSSAASVSGEGAYSMLDLYMWHPQSASEGRGTTTAAAAAADGRRGSVISAEADNENSLMMASDASAMRASLATTVSAYVMPGEERGLQLTSPPENTRVAAADGDADADAAESRMDLADQREKAMAKVAVDVTSWHANGDVSREHLPQLVESAVGGATPTTERKYWGRDVHPAEVQATGNRAPQGYDVRPKTSYQRSRPAIASPRPPTPPHARRGSAVITGTPASALSPFMMEAGAPTSSDDAVAEAAAPLRHTRRRVSCEAIELPEVHTTATAASSEAAVQDMSERTEPSFGASNGEPSQLLLQQLASYQVLAQTPHARKPTTEGGGGAAEGPGATVKPLLAVPPTLATEAATAKTALSSLTGHRESASGIAARSVTCSTNGLSAPFGFSETKLMASAREECRAALVPPPTPPPPLPEVTHQPSSSTQPAARRRSSEISWCAGSVSSPTSHLLRPGAPSPAATPLRSLHLLTASRPERLSPRTEGSAGSPKGLLSPPQPLPKAPPPRLLSPHSLVSSSGTAVDVILDSGVDVPSSVAVLAAAAAVADAAGAEESAAPMHTSHFPSLATARPHTAAASACAAQRPLPPPKARTSGTSLLTTGLSKPWRGDVVPLLRGASAPVSDGFRQRCNGGGLTTATTGAANALCTPLATPLARTPAAFAVLRGGRASP